MAMASSSSRSSCTCKYLVTLLLVFSINIQKVVNCNAFQTFGFEMHHRYSDQVKSIMGGDNLLEKGSLDYYAAMVHRDKVFRGRALAESNQDNSKLLTFSEGNQSFSLPQLGYLYYAYVTLGIPSLSFLVALDTGSDLFWVPCDVTSYGAELNFKIYDSNSSATSKAVSCSNSLCELQRECRESSSQCPYRVNYRDNTSSSGVLVEDVLHLIIEDHEPKDIDARITFGCQRNSVLSTGTPNGLFGLGMGNTSVPSILASKGLIANSFSMCFGFDGVGRINFGDKGSSDQDETPFNLTQRRHYEVSVTQLGMGQNLSDVPFSAIFDSGSSVTYLNDPAYAAICKSFDEQAIAALHKRIPSGPGNPYEYCYDVSSSSAEPFLPNVTLIMEGGSQFNVYGAIFAASNGITTIYCLAVVKSPDVNIIGQNFMTGYRIVFNREQMVLGWKPSNCYEIVDQSTRQKIPQIPKESPTTVNVQPRFVHGGTPRNGLNSGAPKFLVGKPQILYLTASSLNMLFLLILQIV